MRKDDGTVKQKGIMLIVATKNSTDTGISTYRLEEKLSLAACA